MTDGLLLDTHTLLWLDAGSPIKPESRFEIGQARESEALYFSHISIWEIGVALHKKTLGKRPNLRGLTVEAWFAEVTVDIRVRPLSISDSIALEAADVPAVYGYGDPGDCFLIASARLQNLALVTRDARMIELASRRPDYLTVVPC